MSKINCDACGSENVIKIPHEESRHLTLGSEFQYQVPMYQCQSCGEEGDFSHQADEIRETALQEAREKLAIQLIDDIAEGGVKLAHIERVFEIPQRTIASKWRKGSISASGLAFLRIVKTMPWITEIAEQKFTPQSIKHTVGRVCEHYLKEEGVKFTSSRHFGEANSIQIHIRREVQGPGVNRLRNEDYEAVAITTTTG